MWLTRFAGNKAGTFSIGNGYFTITIDQVSYRAHRIIWVLMTGMDPGNLFVDHKNGTRTDNRWTNLRVATPAQNIQNSKNTPGSTGYLGVTRRNGRFFSAIMVNNRRISLGLFDTAKEAHFAYMSARKKYHNEFAPIERCSPQT